jgi:hypothetical protein
VSAVRLPRGTYRSPAETERRNDRIVSVADRLRTESAYLADAMEAHRRTLNMGVLAVELIGGDMARTDAHKNAYAILIDSLAESVVGAEEARREWEAA